MLCYLTDTTRNNGALRVLPGSHAHSLPLHALLPEAHGHAVNSLGTDHPAMRDYPAQVTLPVQAGDAIVTDYRLLHGTHTNHSARRRDCVLMSFLPAWETLPGELLMHLAAHPALPTQCEAAARRACGYDELLPPYSPARASLPIQRMPPVQFTAQD